MELKDAIEVLIMIATSIVTVIASFYAQRERIVKIEGKIEQMEKRLDKGSDTMDELKDSINQLNLTLAKLTAIIDHQK